MIHDKALLLSYDVQCSFAGAILYGDHSEVV